MDELTLVGQVDGITVVLKPLKIVASNHGYSPSYIKRLCQEGKLIAIKYSNLWFVEEHMTATKSLTMFTE